MTKYTTFSFQAGVIIGKRGENLARGIYMDVSDWITQYGAGSFSIIHQRSADSYPYIVTPTLTDGKLYWAFSNIDTAYAGRGRAEVRYTVGSTLAKSLTFETMVSDCLENPGTAPDPYEDWLDTLEELADTISGQVAVHNSSESAHSSLFSAKQNATDNSLSTINKTVVGGINELHVGKLNGMEVVDFYDETGTYAVGDICLYDQKMYKCHTAVTQMESFDFSKWTEIQLMGEIDSIKNGKQDQSDNNLPTSAKTVVGGMSEITGAISNYIPVTMIGHNFIKYDTGELCPHDTSSATDFIQVISGFTVKLTNLYLINSRSICLYDKNQSFVRCEIYNSQLTEYTMKIPDNIAYIRASTGFGQSIYAMYVQLFDALDKSLHDNHVFYVAENGNDNNNGTSGSPLATVNRALENGADTIYLKGGTYAQTIDVSKAKRKSIEIHRLNPTERVIFVPRFYRFTTNESKVDGYNNVYVVTSETGFPELHDDNLWIYQDSVPDASTLISESERHPLQNGRTNRCADTKLVKCTNTDSYQALPEIDASDTFKWFMSASRRYLYYSRPQTVDAGHPLCYSDGSGVFSNNNSNISIKLVGLECKYTRFNLDHFNTVMLHECKVSNCFSGCGMYYEDCQDATFVRCESSHIQSGLVGDGIGSHGSYNGEHEANAVNGTLIDCYCHDNNDDGFSDHQRCRSTLIGGLYEWNTKAGVTPSYGSHCTCYNTLSRNNYVGFLCTGDVIQTEGGNNAQMACYNCIAENNNRGGYMTGFRVNGAGNRAKLYNCISRGNIAAFGTQNTANLDLYNCCASGYNVLTQGNVATYNASLVEVE